MSKKDAILRSLLAFKIKSLCRYQLFNLSQLKKKYPLFLYFYGYLPRQIYTLCFAASTGYDLHQVDAIIY